MKWIHNTGCKLKNNILKMGLGMNNDKSQLRTLHVQSPVAEGKSDKGLHDMNVDGDREQEPDVWLIVIYPL